MTVFRVEDVRQFLREACIIALANWLITRRDANKKSRTARAIRLFVELSVAARVADEERAGCDDAL